MVGLTAPVLTRPSSLWDFAEPLEFLRRNYCDGGTCHRITDFEKSGVIKWCFKILVLLQMSPKIRWRKKWPICKCSGALTCVAGTSTLLTEEQWSHSSWVLQGCWNRWQQKKHISMLGYYICETRNPNNVKTTSPLLESEVLIDDVSKWATTRTAKCTLQLRGCGFNCFQLYKETWFTEIKVLWPRDVHGFDVIGGVEANNAPPVAWSYICIIPALQSFFRILDRLLEGLQCQPCFPPSLLSFQKT